MDAQAQNRGLIRSDWNAFLPDDFRQNGACGAHFSHNLHLAVNVVFGIVVVVVDMNFHIFPSSEFGEFSYPALLSRVYQNESFYSIQIHVLDLCEVE